MLLAKMSLSFLLGAIFTHADHGGEQHLVEKIDHMKSSVSRAEESQRKLYRQVIRSDQKVKQVSEERAKINEKVLASEADSQELAYEVKQWEKKVRNQRQRIAKSISHIYRMKNPSLLAFLFSNQSASEIEKNIFLLKKLSEKDFELFKSFQLSLKSAKEARESLKSEVRKLLSLRERLKRKESELLGDQKKKMALLHEIRSNKQKNIALLKKLRSKLPELDREAGEAIFEKKGQLHAPAVESPTKLYGSVFDPIYKVKFLHLGWTYEHLLPSPVKVIFQGVVSYVGPIPGFGETLVIDHGDHYYSVYSHVSTPQVFQGEQVFTGQTIATTSGNLYFEMRHFSSSIDPSKWIQSDQLNQVAGLKAPIQGEAL